MLTISTTFTRTSENESQWTAKDSKKMASHSKNESNLSLGLPDIPYNEEMSACNQPSSAVSSSSLNYRRASEATPDCRKSSRRPVSVGVTVKRNSSNRSTASEGGSRKTRKRTFLVPDEDESVNTQNLSPIVGTAASLLRLVLPFSWERRNSKNPSPNREIVQTDSTSPPIKQLPLPIPYPQRAPPPVPVCGKLGFGDHISISSGNSSLAGHIYEQVSFSPERSSEDKERESNVPAPLLPNLQHESANLNFESCIPGQVRAVKRPSRKRKKSRSKGTYTDESEVNKVLAEDCSSIKIPVSKKDKTILSFSLPQKHCPDNNHFCHVDYVRRVSLHNDVNTDKIESCNISSLRNSFSLSLNSSSPPKETLDENCNKTDSVIPSTKTDCTDECAYEWYSSKKMDVSAEMTDGSSSTVYSKKTDKDYLHPPPPPHSSPDRRGTLTRTIRFFPSYAKQQDEVPSLGIY